MKWLLGTWKAEIKRQQDRLWSITTDATCCNQAAVKKNWYDNLVTFHMYNYWLHQLGID